MAERPGRAGAVAALLLLVLVAWLALPERREGGRVSETDTLAPATPPPSAPAPAPPLPPAPAPGEGSPAPARGKSAISAVVTDGNGLPVSMARYHVSLAPPESAPGPTDHGGYTDGEGRFSVPAVPGRTYVVEVEPDARGSARVEGVAAGTVDLPVVLLPFGRGDLTGSVRDAEGVPAVGIQVTARLLVEGRRPSGGGRLPFDGWEIEWGTEGRSVLTLDGGAFDFGRLPPGRWVAWAGAPGTAWCPDNLVVVEAGKGPEPVELRLRRGRTLRARLLDGEGRPRPGVEVVLRDLDPLGEPGPTWDLFAVSGPDGLLEVPGLPPGPVKVWDHRAEPRATWTVEERPGDAEPVELAPK